MAATFCIALVCIYIIISLRVHRDSKKYVLQHIGASNCQQLYILKGPSAALPPSIQAQPTFSKPSSGLSSRFKLLCYVAPRGQHHSASDSQTGHIVLMFLILLIAKRELLSLLLRKSRCTTEDSVISIITPQCFVTSTCSIFGTDNTSPRIVAILSCFVLVLLKARSFLAQYLTAMSRVI